MPGRFSDIEKSSLPKPSLEERLREYPELKAKIETMLGIIENAGGDIGKGAEDEGRSFGELRRVGNVVLHGWAQHQQQKKGLSARIWKNVHLARVLKNEELNLQCAQGRHPSQNGPE